MLTGYLCVGPTGLLVLGVTPEDLRALSAEQACTLDGAKFGLPELKIFVTHTEGEAEFYELCRGMAADLKRGQTGLEVIEVHAPPDGLKEPS